MIDRMDAWERRYRAAKRWRFVKDSLGLLAALACAAAWVLVMVAWGEQ